ncbi:MAG: amino acid ABC transporter permease [Anaerolineales bacterium]|nr:amino acid ABC transporter permease [Anaerolineales bacterium]
MATTADRTYPSEPSGVLIWLRKNLFNNWYNSLLTILSFLMIAWAMNAGIRWVFITADWRPVLDHPILYLVGQYPRDLLWRPGASLLVISVLVGASWGNWGQSLRMMAIAQAAIVAMLVIWPSQVGITLPMRGFIALNLPAILLGYLLGKHKFTKSSYVLVAWVISTPIILLLWSGIAGIDALPVVATGRWGGLMVTLFLAVGGIVISFPIGVLLALGRRSSLPVVKFVCIAFIEGIRGVPLITLLFMVHVVLAIFLPGEVRFDRLLRALVAMTAFSAAYMAENVRGGLAAIPQGQIEAAKAVGLNNFQVTVFIVLPQALRIVIPPIVGQFISLFKDTTLAAGIAVPELLMIGRAIIQSDQTYLRLQMEVFLFIAAVFWLFCYLMSYASLKLEAALGVGER